MIDKFIPARESAVEDLVSLPKEVESQRSLQ